MATAIGLLYAPLDLRGNTYLGRVLRAWVTVVIGISFFAAAFFTSRHVIDMKKALPWLYAGLGITIVWGFLQAVAINTEILNTDSLDKIQKMISVNDLFKNRVNAFAYEPSWLSDQLLILSLPWLVGAVISGFRLTKWKWLEPVLAGASIGLLLFTYSRSGMFNIVLVTGLVFFFTGGRFFRRFWDWLKQPFGKGDWSGIALRVAVIVLIVAGLVTAAVVLNSGNYFSNLWEIDLSQGINHYLRYNFVGGRVTYMLAGFDTFAEHPWTGVGLGGSSLYLYDHVSVASIPDFPEVARIMSPDSTEFMNIKNMYVRLLAETGLVGFWLFMAFLFSVLASFIKRLSDNDLTSIYIGITGLFAWFAVILRYFSQDSFTSPFVWVVLGMCLGYARRIQFKTKG
jgi:O-antigen ligase